MGIKRLIVFSKIARLSTKVARPTLRALSLITASLRFAITPTERDWRWQYLILRKFLLIRMRPLNSIPTKSLIRARFQSPTHAQTGQRRTSCDTALCTEPFDHVERGFYVAALVVMLQKFCAVERVEVIHPTPQL